MPIYFIVHAPVDSNTSVFFFEDRDKAFLKYGQLFTSHQETHIYQMYTDTVERLYPKDGTFEPIEFEKEIVL